MYESEIANLLGATQGDLQNLLAWSTGISSGILALSFAAAKRLTWFLVGVVLVLYVSFWITFPDRLGFLT